MNQNQTKYLSIIEELKEVKKQFHESDMFTEKRKLNEKFSQLLVLKELYSDKLIK